MPFPLAANALILLIFMVAAILFRVDPDLYYRSAQEDAPLEWFTFWAFVLAAIVFTRNARSDYLRRGGLPWFAAGLAGFSLLVALEEISWGQRLLTYQPPEFFLARNDQQEFNLHNIVATDLRRLGMQSVLIGYGVVLALLGTIPAFRSRFGQLRIVAPPPALAPGFAACAAIYAWYPHDFTGEWVEAATGLAFLAVGVATAEGRPRPGRLPLLAGVAAIQALATTGLLSGGADADTARGDLAEQEVAALAVDFEGPKLHTRCGIHKRLYTFLYEYNQPQLLRGQFAELVRQQDPVRADYLLDPWNAPYWVRHSCAEGRAVAFVYSFGPNRRRDSDDWALGGDDIGRYFIERRQ